MPSGTQPEEPDDDAHPGGVEGSSGSDPEVPVHPDDRIWRHPSELARMRAAKAAAMPTPTSIRRPTNNPWVSRIPTSLVIAAGLATMMASVGAVVALSQRSDQPERQSTATFTSQVATSPITSIESDGQEAQGVIVDPAGIVLVAMHDPPAEASMEFGRRKADVTLRSTDSQLGLAAYQVDEIDEDGANPESVAPTTLSGPPPAGSDRAWPMPNASSDLSDLDVEWVESGWGLMLMTDGAPATLAPGPAMAEGGELLGIATVTAEGDRGVVPWPVLKAVGARLSPNRPKSGKLPASIEDQDDGAMITDEWSDGALESGDLLASMDGLPISSAKEAMTLASFHRAGESTRVRCHRSGREVSVEVELE